MDSDIVPLMYTLLPWPIGSASRMRLTTRPLLLSHDTPFHVQQSLPVHDLRAPLGSFTIPALKSNKATRSSSPHSAVFCPWHQFNEISSNIATNAKISDLRFSIAQARKLQRVFRNFYALGMNFKKPTLQERRVESSRYLNHERSLYFRVSSQD